MTLDLTEAVLHYKEKELKLSGNEFGILKILMKNPKKTCLQGRTDAFAVGIRTFY